VDSRLNISNFIADTIFDADADGLLHFRFDRELTSFKLDSLVELPDTTLPVQTFTLEQQFSLQPGQEISIFPPSEIKFNIGNGAEITIADVRKGSIKVTFSNNTAEPLDLTYMLPGATKNGVSFTIKETIPPGAGSLQKEYDLSGYRLSLRGLNNNKVNALVQTYTVGLNINANPLTITPGQGPSISLSYSEIVPEYIEGFFGTDPVKIPADTAAFTFLENVQAKNFLLSKARMEFRLENEFGADFEASLTGIKSINLQNGMSVQLIPDKLSVIHLDWPVRTWNSLTASAKTILFDETNSNITTFISNLPDHISYQGSVQINPLVKKEGNFIGHTNYAFYNRGIRVMADIDIPMRFSGEEISLQSVAKVDFSNVDQLSRVNSGRFVMRAKNGYPFTARLQAYMLDELGQTIDSLFVTGANYIEKGKLNAQNDVTEPTFTELFVPVTREKIDHLARCRSLRILTTFLLPPSPPDIKIFDHYEVDLKIAAELNYNAAIGK
jgi:hypothetical protein